MSKEREHYVVLTAGDGRQMRLRIGDSIEVSLTSRIGTAEVISKMPLVLTRVECVK